MEDFDLLKIERFIFQVYDHFLSYWRTLGYLITSPSKIIESLREIEDEDDNKESAVEVPEPVGKAEPSPKVEGQVGPKSSNSKQEKWSGLLTRDLATPGKRKKRKKEEENAARFRFEEKKDGRSPICLPVLFALFNVCIITVVGLCMFPFIIDTFGWQETRSVDVEILSSAILTIVIAFATAQSVDTFFVKRGHPSRARECLALCCYATGYLVPYYILNLIGVIIGYDVYFEVAWLGIGMFLALGLIAILGLVFWKRGLKHLYAPSTFALIRASVTSFFGAVFIGVIVILFFEPTLISHSRNMTRFNDYLENYRYQSAILLGRCLLREDISKGEKIAIRQKILVAKCRFNVDVEERLAKVAKELEKTLRKNKEKIDLGLHLEEALEHLQYRPDECGGPKFTFWFKTARRTNRKETMSVRYIVPTHDLLRQPMKSIPQDIDNRIKDLEAKLRNNIEQLLKKTEFEVGSHKRNVLIHQLANIMQDYHLEKKANAKKQFAYVEAIYWDIQRQRLQLLKWMKRFPEWILAKDYDADEVF